MLSAPLGSWYAERQRDGQADRQTDIQTDRPTATQTDRQTGIFYHGDPQVLDLDYNLAVDSLGGVGPIPW